MTTATMQAPQIAYNYEGNGEVRCLNPRGLTFFLIHGAGKLPEVSAAPTTPKSPAPAPAWKPVESNREVMVRHHVEPAPMMEMTRAIPQAANFTAVEATREVEVRRHAEAPVAEAAPAQQAPKGWFNKLFTK